MKYILKAYDSTGDIYGYYAPHPDGEKLPFYDDDPKNAIVFDCVGDADAMIETLENGSELEIIACQV